MMRDISLVKTNLAYYLEDKALRAGFYRNVESLSSSISYGGDLGALQLVNEDPNFDDGTVYQSAFKNWVHESGIPAPRVGISEPTSYSGVYVNGTFYDKDTAGAYSHNVDFPNGRIIFDNALNASDEVSASFAYKEFFVKVVDRQFNQLDEVSFEGLYKDNPLQTGIDAYPRPNEFWLPGVFVEFDSRLNSGYELGSVSNVKDYLFDLHVLGRDTIVDEIADFISDTYRDVIVGVDYNSAPFPTLRHGFRNDSYTRYADYANLYSAFRWRKIYVESTDVFKEPSLLNMERRRVQVQLRVYPNF